MIITNNDETQIIGGYDYIKQTNSFLTIDLYLSNISVESKIINKDNNVSVVTGRRYE